MGINAEGDQITLAEKDLWGQPAAGSRAELQAGRAPRRGHYSPLGSTPPSRGIFFSLHNQLVLPTASHPHTVYLVVELGLVFSIPFLQAAGCCSSLPTLHCTSCPHTLEFGFGQHQEAFWCPSAQQLLLPNRSHLPTYRPCTSSHHPGHIQIHGWIVSGGKMMHKDLHCPVCFILILCGSDDKTIISHKSWMISWKTENTQNMPSFTVYLTQASRDVNLFGSRPHDKIRILANVNRKTTVCSKVRLCIPSMFLMYKGCLLGCFTCIQNKKSGLR